MSIKFRKAVPEDAAIIGEMIVALTTEICVITNAQHFDICLSETIDNCRELLLKRHYEAILGFDENYENRPIGVVTMAETYALYAGGKVGVIQEFYTLPEHRSSGIGSLLVEQVKLHGQQSSWACIELCTPPLPEFERSLQFYERNGLKPVGGRKMRQSLV
ncbi:GNAT family N-acetyltransferase [Marinomonas sp.]|nr:GNAT family N-acetyltransferase [Marinomonas sp.]MDB4837167.1 GNAT family N-acetyltransferase [Marinomonas sp.]